MPPKKTMEFEAHFIKKDTQKIPMEISARMVKFSGILYSVMVARDIEDRLAAQKALKSLKSIIEQYSRILDLPH